MAELGLNCLRQAIGVNEVFDPMMGLKPAANDISNHGGIPDFRFI